MVSVPLNLHGDAINHEKKISVTTLGSYLALEGRGGAPLSEPMNITQVPDYSRLTESWDSCILLSPWRSWSPTHLRGVFWPLTGWIHTEGQFPLGLMQPFPLLVKKPLLRRNLLSHAPEQQMASIFRGPSEEGLMPLMRK